MWGLSTRRVQEFFLDKGLFLLARLFVQIDAAGTSAFYRLDWSDLCSLKAAEARSRHARCGGDSIADTCSLLEAGFAIEDGIAVVISVIARN